MNRFFKSILALFIITIVSLFIAEIAARFVFKGYMPILKVNRFMESERGKFSTYDPMLGWVGKVGAQADFEWIDTKAFVRQNQYGFRDVGYPFTKGDKKRLVVLGDSYVWGFGVNNDQLFTSLIADSADKGNGREVINLGVSGYTTDQEYLLWKRLGYKWSPEDVLLLILPSNDLKELLGDKAHGYAKPRYVLAPDGAMKLQNVPVAKRKSWQDKTIEGGKTSSTLLQRLLSRSTLANMIVGVAIRNENIRIKLRDKGIIPYRRFGGSRDFFIYMDEPTDEIRGAWNLLFKLVGMLDKSVRDNGGRLRVAVIPTIVQVYPDLWKSYVEQVSLPASVTLRRDKTFNIVRTACAKLGVEVIDLVSDLREAGKREPYLYFPFNRHWTREGHRVVAGSIRRALDNAR